MYYLGVDPGAAGAIAIIDKDCFVINIIDYQQDLNFLYKDVSTYSFKIKNALIEHVHSMPKQGVKSMFTFGENYGKVQGILSAANINYNFISPKKWKNEILKDYRKGEKFEALTYARKKFPNAELDKKKHMGRADALCIAEMALRLSK